MTMLTSLKALLFPATGSGPKAGPASAPATTDFAALLHGASAATPTIALPLEAASFDMPPVDLGGVAASDVPAGLDAPAVAQALAARPGTIEAGDIAAAPLPQTLHGAPHAVPAWTLPPATPATTDAVIAPTIDGEALPVEDVAPDAAFIRPPAQAPVQAPQQLPSALAEAAAAVGTEALPQAASVPSERRGPVHAAPPVTDAALASVDANDAPAEPEEEGQASDKADVSPAQAATASAPASAAPVTQPVSAASLVPLPADMPPVEAEARGQRLAPGSDLSPNRAARAFTAAPAQAQPQRADPDRAALPMPDDAALPASPPPVDGAPVAQSDQPQADAVMPVTASALPTAPLDIVSSDQDFDPVRQGAPSPSAPVANEARSGQPVHHATDGTVDAPTRDVAFAPEAPVQPADPAVAPALSNAIEGGPPSTGSAEAAAHSAAPRMTAAVAASEQGRAADLTAAAPAPIAGPAIAPVAPQDVAQFVDAGDPSVAVAVGTAASSLVPDKAIPVAMPAVLPIIETVSETAPETAAVDPATILAIAGDKPAGPVTAEAVSLLNLVRNHMRARSSTTTPSTMAEPVAPAIDRTTEAPVPTADRPPVVMPAAQPAFQTPVLQTAATPAIDLSVSLGAQVVDMGVSGQWIDGLARDIAGLSANGAQGRFQINAGQLGPVQVDIRQGMDGAAVSLTVATDMAEQALRQDSDRLKLDASLSAVRISEVKIERAPTVAEAARSDQAGNQSQQSSQQQSGNWQGQTMGQSQGWGQSSAQSQMHGRQPRENIVQGHKAGGDPAVLNHEQAGGDAADLPRARYA